MTDDTLIPVVRFAYISDDPRLGRHVEHDPRSWDYQAERAKALRSVRHDRKVPVFDQGNVGSCTGNAAAGAMMTAPFFDRVELAVGHPYTEADAIGIYKDATRIDGIPGEYPDQDTGSSGLAVARVLRRRGLIGSYRHAFGLDHALHAAVLRPVIVGVPWLSSFDTPTAEGDDAGECVWEPGAWVRGGHEVVVDEIDVDRERVWFTNSWSTEWNLEGRGWWSFPTFGNLLGNHGDVTTFHV